MYTDQGSSADNGQGGRADQSLQQPKATQPPAISLPKGGGAIRGMGEKFAANPVTGTGSMTVPIATSPGRSGFGPQLSLSYDSGAGNGPFGLGWSLSIPSITRKTDKGLPQYRDAEESDVFILSGAEDLVPVLMPNGDRFQDSATFPGFVVHRYRPRIEGLFARIERWTDQTTGISHWRSISKDNITTLYGKRADARIADPADPTHTFSWLICESYDDKGNAILYTYKSEDDKNIERGAPQEQNRLRPAAKFSQRYLKRIQYGNATPRLPSEDLTLRTDWLFEAVFDYGEHDTNRPEVSDDPLHSNSRSWPVRKDPFSTYRAGFEVRTYRLCRRVLMFHHFPAELSVDDCLVRSTEFSYSEGAVASFITQVTQSGYVRQPTPAEPNRYLRKALPPLEFTYSQVPTAEELAARPILELDAASLENLPIGMDGTVYQWVDLDGEGLSGLLTDQGDGWFYKRNTSANNLVRDNGNQRPVARFAPLERVTTRPAGGLRGGQAQFMDLAGDGQPDLVLMEGPIRGFFERTPDEAWEPFRPFRAWPNVDTRDPNLKFIDLNGDGHSDILITEHDAFTWYGSLAEDGFGPAQRTFQPWDEENGPRLVFADSEQSIYLADLSGDGLTDIVRIRNGEVCYWPNVGYGRFGAKVTMDNAPWFDQPDQFDQKRIRLADIDGSGVTDILYLSRQGVQIFYNQSGNRWSDRVTLENFPALDNLAAVQAVDLLGNGTACLVWSSPLPGYARRPMRYLDLMGEKPHLLVKTVNNLGAETVVQYAPSTRFYLQDRLAGKPWLTKLPFPVHVVERVETYDRVSGNRFVARYEYHHGYFDGVEREFRGFGMVEQWDTEEIGSVAGGQTSSLATNLDVASFVPPIHTKTWFHTGIYLEGAANSQHLAAEYYGAPDESDTTNFAAFLTTLLGDTVLPPGLTLDEERQACRALKGAMLRQEVYALDGTSKEEHPYNVTEQNFTIERLQPQDVNRYAVFFTHAREAISYHYERNPDDPRIQHALTLAVDSFGNVLRSLAIGYPRANVPERQPEQNETHLTLTLNRFANRDDQTAWYRVGLPVASRTYEVVKPPTAAQRFTWDELRELVTALVPLNQDEPVLANTILYEQWDWRKQWNAESEPGGLVNGAPLYTRLRLIEHARTHYRGDDLTALLALGVVQSLALLGESYKLAFTSELLTQVYHRKLGTAPAEELLPDPAQVLGGMGGDQGGYVDLDGDGCWWIPSGQIFFSTTANTRNPAATAVAELAEARQHFFLPRKFSDPFDHSSTVDYDLYDLLAVKTEDAVQNTVTARHDYRVLQPRAITDPNGNRSEAAFDALGLVVGTAVMGKATGRGEGDSFATFTADLTPQQIKEYFDAVDPRPLAMGHSGMPGHLGTATMRILYDLDRVPACAATIARETHVSELGAGEVSKVQLSFSYSDGFGREIQKKIQAEADFGLFANDLLTDGPVAYFRLNESVGATQATDASGNGKHGNVSATDIMLQQPGLGAGDTAARFSGQGSGRIVVPDSERLNPKQITLEALISWAGPTGSTQQRIVEKSFSAGEPAEPSYGLSILATGGVRVELSIRGRSEPVFVTSQSRLTTNVATHLAATYDGNTIAIYVNGVLDASAVVPGEIISNVENFGASDIGIGNQVERARQFNGLLDEVAIYDKALPADRIRAHVAKVKVGDAPRSRWVGSGWTIFNNKGKPVRQYEPFFSPTHSFEFGVTVGVSPILFYDPAERVVATLHPNHTFEKVVFDPWQQTTWDVNDTLTLNPKRDPDVRGFFIRLPDNDYLPTWYDRMRASTDTDERNAAERSEAHAATPTIAHFDALGRPFLTLADNGAQGKYATRVELDIEGNQHSVTDALGRIVMSYDYDLLGNRIKQASMEAGVRWMLANAAGKPIRAWDDRNFTRRMTYDALHRPTGLYVTEPAGERLAEQTIYGEAKPSPETTNHRGKVWQVCDDAGIVTSEEYDFKGGLLSGKRDLRTAYKTAVNWEQLPTPATSETFTSSSKFDALGRVIEAVAPDGSVTKPRYNEANLLEAVDVRLRGAAAFTPFVRNIDYDAKGQRTRIEYNQAATPISTEYTYDPDTFRLTRLITTRPNHPLATERTLQALHYTYDPVGNITHIQDDAQQTIYFDGQVVEPHCDYVYDALYRLIDAKGREHIGQLGQPETTWNDEFRVNLPHPHDGQAMRNYSEQYVYDAVGNFEQLIHQAADGNWTRSYTYNEPSLLERTTQKSNRLSSTQVGVGTPEPYNYDAHGNMTAMPQLQIMQWDFKDQLQMTQRQAVNAQDGGGVQRQGERTYYVYDAAGQRVRKVTELANSNLKDERIYLGGFEIYRQHAGANAGLMRETLHIMDDKQRIALVETRTQGNDGSPAQLIRYQFGNHLGSASLELDEEAQIISYEEYMPYGSTSYQAVRSQTKTPKRYRYTGKERDEESGLYYHGARYYAPWLARWVSCDPAGLADGPSSYIYAQSAPTTGSDPTGFATKPMSFEQFQNDLGEIAKELSSGSDDLVAKDRRTSSPANSVSVDSIKGTEAELSKTTPTKAKGELKTGPYRKKRGHHVEQSAAFKNKSGKDPMRQGALSVSQKEGALSKPKPKPGSSNSVAHQRAGQVQSAVDQGRLGKNVDVTLPADVKGRLPEVSVKATGSGTLMGTPSPWAEDVKGQYGLLGGGAHPEDALNATLSAAEERKAAEMLPTRIPGSKWQNVKEGAVTLLEKAAKSKGLKALVVAGGILAHGVAKAAPVVGTAVGAADVASEVQAGDPRRATLTAIGMSEIPFVSQTADIGLAIEDASGAAKEILDPEQKLEMWYYNTFLK